MIDDWMSRALRFGVYLAVLWVALVVSALLQERLLIFYPSEHVRRTPADAGLNARDLTIHTPDGETLRGWWIGNQGTTVLIWFHGNAGNRGHRVDAARWLVRTLDVDVVLVDYRGYGGSTGRPAETGLYTDGLAVYDHVRNAGVEPARIVLYGRSLGAAVAIQTALDRPARALVIESAFLSIPALARLHYPFVPSSLVRTQMDNEAKAHRIDVPTLVLHGGQDRTVPASHGKRLHAKLTARKRLHVVESAEHNDIRRQGGAAYAEAWRTFLRQTEERP